MILIIVINENQEYCINFLLIFCFFLKKVFDLQISYIEMWFTDKNFNSLEVTVAILVKT